MLQSNRLVTFWYIPTRNGIDGLTRISRAVSCHARHGSGPVKTSHAPTLVDNMLPTAISYPA